MRWSERQRAMLAEMGVRIWPRGLQEESAGAESPAAGARVESARQDSDPSPPPPAAALAPGTVAAKGPVIPISLIHQPAAGDTATMDWSTLRLAVSECTACKLCEARRQTVFGVGNPRAHWMIVGEAPGEQEDLLGEPFVGKSGQLLDNMLRAVHLTRQEAPVHQQVYIANTVKCRPPGNRNPLPEELARCEPFLIRQLELVRPRIILAMGRFAVQSLLRSHEPIGKLRGRVHDFRGVPLIVTYHPAYLLRSLEEKARAWDDLCLAAETVKSCTGS